MDVVFSPTGIFSISGTISGAGGNGATVSLIGPPAQPPPPMPSGNYSFHRLANGSYTVTASNPGFTFSPASQSATVTNASVTGVNFSTAAQRPPDHVQHLRHDQRRGRQRRHREPERDFDRTAITADASGNYTFTGMANGSYTVTPSNTGFTFTPASQAVTVSSASVTGINFSTGHLQYLTARSAAPAATAPR